jgi:hypothetical protein
MKKILLSLVALVAMCLSAQAQMTLSVMPKAGISLANMSVPSLLTDPNANPFEFNIGDDFNSKLGILGGVALNIGINDMFSIQPELNFIQKGTSYTTNSFNNNSALTNNNQKANDPGLGQFQFNLTTNYLELPVLGRLAFGSEDFKFFALAGPYVAMGLSGKAKTKLGAGITVLEGEGDIVFDSDKAPSIFDDSNIAKLFSPSPSPDWNFNNRIDFGVQFGIGGGVKLGPGMAILDARYGLGLSSVYKEYKVANQTIVSEDKLKSANRTIQISLGYMIPLGN